MTRRKKERFWAGSGKFFILLIFAYLALMGIKRIYNSGGKVSGKYAIEDIQIVNNRIMTAVQILHLCGNDEDRDSVVIDYNQLAKKILQLTYVKGVSITRRPPNLLNITIEERKPLSFIYGKGLNLIDEEGYLMPVPIAGCVYDLPIITGVRSSLGKLGEKTVIPDVYFVLTMLNHLREENIIVLDMISEINLSAKDYITLYLIKGGVPVRVNKETYRKELYILKNYLANHVDWRLLKKFEYIDLRFENQLIIKPRS
jgi:cell division septal protein FtsQ